MDSVTQVNIPVVKLLLMFSFGFFTCKKIAMLDNSSHRPESANWCWYDTCCFIDFSAVPFSTYSTFYRHRSYQMELIINVNRITIDCNYCSRLSIELNQFTIKIYARKCFTLCVHFHIIFSLSRSIFKCFFFLFAVTQVAQMVKKNWTVSKE